MIPLAEALAWLEAHCPRLPAQSIALDEAAGRVLASDVRLPAAPAWAVATIDGWAVRAAETEGASDYAPLPVRGVPVQAGSPMPEGTDAVVPAHASERPSPVPEREGLAARDEVGSVMAQVPRGHGVAQPGHDVASGTVLPAGTRLTALHLAMLSGEVSVVRRPIVGGNASPTLRALAAQQGAGLHGQPHLLLDPACGFPAQFTAIAIRPGETTRLGRIDTTPAIGLPLQPADAATVFALLVAPILRHLGGQPEPLPVPARLTRKIASGLGQLDAVRVRVEAGEATPLGPAEGLGLSLAANANGLVLVPEGSEGYPAGTMVSVIPL